MLNAHVLIGAGLMTVKDWAGLAIDIEQFRKQEQGSQQAPGDFLRDWLSDHAGAGAPAHPVAAVAPEHKPKRADKLEAKRQADRPLKRRAPSPVAAAAASPEVPA